MTNNKLIIIFSVNLFFTNVLKRVYEDIDNTLEIKVFDAFSAAQTKIKDQAISMIVVDDLIVGASSFELISYLRKSKRLSCPILYFGTEEYNNEEKALKIGANQFFSKPFDPYMAERLIKHYLKK